VGVGRRPTPGLPWGGSCAARSCSRRTSAVTPRSRPDPRPVVCRSREPRASPCSSPRPTRGQRWRRCPRRDRPAAWPAAGPFGQRGPWPDCSLVSDQVRTGPAPGSARPARPHQQHRSTGRWHIPRQALTPGRERPPAPHTGGSQSPFSVIPTSTWSSGLTSPAPSTRKPGSPSCRIVVESINVRG
jgi:hypothetical protein